MSLIFQKPQIIILFLLGSLLGSMTAHGAEYPVANDDEPGFIEPELIKSSKPRYPSHELRNANAGMVDIIFMVDKDGNTFEPFVTVASKPSFEKPAIDAIKKYRYKPATLNGNAIESVKALRVVFLVSRQDDQVSKSFHKNYKSALKELDKEEPNKLLIEEKITAMENSDHMSPYSYRHLNTIKHTHAEKFDSKQAQIDSIYQLLLFEPHTKNAKSALDDSQRINARRRLVTLLIQTAHYGSAIDEYKALKKIDPGAEELFKDAFKQINDLLESDQLVTTSLELNAQGHNSTILFKNTFGFIKGNNINRVKLRCSKKFADLEYSLDSEYKIPKSWGTCHLQIIGTPDSSIKLYQL